MMNPALSENSSAKAHGARLIPLAILGLCAFAYWQPYRPAWRWAIALAAAFAVWVFLRALAERKQVLQQPLSAAVTAFVVAKLIGPIMVVIVALPALISDNEPWLGAAQVLTVTFAVLWLL